MLVIFKLSFWFSLLFSCRTNDPEIGNRIIDSVEFQESRGYVNVRDNGQCVGVMQIDSRYSPFPKKFLRVPFLNRIAGTRAIHYWKRRAGGDIKIALAAYNCGNAGLRGVCGVGYANSVLSRNKLYHREYIPECSILGNVINYYLDNKHYLVKWRNKKWQHYQHLPRHQQQQP